MLGLALQNRDERSVAIVCNTPHDRYSGLRGTQRISVGRSTDSPKHIVKRAVVNSLTGNGALFYQASSILKYCGYQPRFGFQIRPIEQHDQEVNSLLLEQLVSPIDEDESKIADGELQLASSFLKRHPLSKQVWIDASDQALEFSLAREFASVLKLESKLRSMGVFRSIQVFLQRAEDGETIEIRHASSGQLALISSLLFLITSTGENPLVIVDEPENSLHPNWQREYVSKVLTALSYRNASVYIATHAPLIVTGALSSNPELVSVLEMRGGTTQKLPIDHRQAASSSIEEVLWRAFEVVTPANHFVSEQIVEEVSRYERGEIRKEEVLKLIHRMRGESFDTRQRVFFDAVIQLLNKIQAGRSEDSPN